MNILPTHTCFDDALDFLGALLQIGRLSKDELNEYVVVHGICTAPDGNPYAHAWVEQSRARLIWQGGVVDGVRVWFAVPIEEFDREYRPQITTRYTPAETARENARTNHFGPWKDEYFELCVNGPPAVRSAFNVNAIVFYREDEP
jgi:hypothetical protein